jgi:putative sigma-54 modulation protein
MQIHLSPRHLQLTASIHQAVAIQIGQLEELGTDIVGAHVVLLKSEAANPEERFTVKVHLAVAGPDIHAEDSENDLYVAMERVTAKLARQLRKRKTALNDKRRSTSQRAVKQQKAGQALPSSVRKGLRSVRKAAAAV